LQTIVTAAARLPSFAHAAFAVGLTGLSISSRHIHNLTAEIGAELAKQRDDRAEKRRKRQLVPRVAVAPEAVAVEVDGGRLRTRAAGQGPGVHDKQNKENKVACLVTLRSVEHAHDPQPEPPPSFLQPRRIQRLVRQMGGLAGDVTHEDRGQEDAAPGEAERHAAEAERWSPERLVRTCVASMVESRAFGPLMAAEAQSRNFQAAKRRAFVADGQAYNWSIQRGHFADYVPIVDFLHVICYLFTAAQALGSDEETRWRLYVGWLRCCWQGRVSEVLSDLLQRQQGVGRPPPGEELSDRDPRRVLAEALSYLRNNVARMDYPRYRRMGLPTTSSLVESLVGEFNARVKDERKFWNRPEGAEAILQVRAALLSEDGRLERHFTERPGCPYRRRTTAHRAPNPRRAV
jgi:hypothetical protein